MSKRSDDNWKLINHLQYLNIKYPDMRFSQLLQNFGFIKPERPVKDPGRINWQNEFYLEGDKLLERVEKRIKDVETEK